MVGVPLMLRRVFAFLVGLLLQPLSTVKSRFLSVQSEPRTLNTRPHLAFGVIDVPRSASRNRMHVRGVILVDKNVLLLVSRKGALVLDVLRRNRLPANFLILARRIVISRWLPNFTHQQLLAE